MDRTMAYLQQATVAPTHGTSQGSAQSPSYYSTAAVIHQLAQNALNSPPLLHAPSLITSTPLPSSSQPTLSEDSEVPSTAVTPADHHDDMQHKLDLHHKNVPPKSSGAVECLTIQEDEGESHPSQTNQDPL